MLFFHFIRIVMLACICALPSNAQADWRPNRPIKIYVGFGHGSSTDVLTRIVADHLAKSLGQPVVVENKIGAAGSIASDLASKSAPDGHSLIMLTGSHASVAATHRKLPYDPIEDFSMISLLAAYGLVVAVSARSPIEDLGGFVARAKAKPRTVSYASGGWGSGTHLIGEMLNADLGIDMLHIPMRADAAAVTEVAAGRVDLIIQSMAGALPHVRSTSLRPIAVTSSQRAKELPAVPTLAETVPGVSFDSFNGLAAPRGTPGSIVDAINQELRNLVTNDEALGRLKQSGVDIRLSTPGEMKAAFASMIGKLKRVVEVRKIELR